MNIKLNARLSAYTKVDNVGCEHPEMGSVTNEQIDQLFEGADTPVSVTKSEIDDLFTEDGDHVVSVSHSEIDSLFKR